MQREHPGNRRLPLKPWMAVSLGLAAAVALALAGTAAHAAAPPCNPCAGIFVDDVEQWLAPLAAEPTLENPVLDTAEPENDAADGSESASRSAESADPDDRPRLYVAWKAALDPAGAAAPDPQSGRHRGGSLAARGVRDALPLGGQPGVSRRRARTTLGPGPRGASEHALPGRVERGLASRQRRGTGRIRLPLQARRRRSHGSAPRRPRRQPASAPRGRVGSRRSTARRSRPTPTASRCCRGTRPRSRQPSPRSTSSTRANLSS